MGLILERDFVYVLLRLLHKQVESLLLIGCVFCYFPQPCNGSTYAPRLRGIHGGLAYWVECGYAGYLCHIVSRRLRRHLTMTGEGS